MKSSRLLYYYSVRPTFVPFKMVSAPVHAFSSVIQEEKGLSASESSDSIYIQELKKASRALAAPILRNERVWYQYTKRDEGKVV